MLWIKLINPIIVWKGKKNVIVLDYLTKFLILKTINLHLTNWGIVFKEFQYADPFHFSDDEERAKREVVTGQMSLFGSDLAELDKYKLGLVK